MTAESRCDVAVAFLFDQPGEVVENVKFFSGSSPFTEQAFWEQVHAGLLQERSGTAIVSTQFVDNAKTVDARALLNSL